MTNKTICSTIDNAVCIFQTGSQIVGVQDRYFCSLGESFRTHHPDISVCNGENTRTTERSGRYLILCIAEDTVSGQERNQMFRYTDRTYSRTSATVWWGECLMKIQVADIRADESRISQSHLRVHIGSIHIYLRSASMDNVADLFYFRFKYTVGGGISDHQRSQFLLVLFGFGT